MSAVFIPAKQKTISATSRLNSGKDALSLVSGNVPVKNIFKRSKLTALFSGTSALGIAIVRNRCILP